MEKWYRLFEQGDKCPPITTNSEIAIVHAIGAFNNFVERLENLQINEKIKYGKFTIKRVREDD